MTRLSVFLVFLIGAMAFGALGAPSMVQTTSRMKNPSGCRPYPQIPRCCRKTIRCTRKVCITLFKSIKEGCRRNIFVGPACKQSQKAYLNDCFKGTCGQNYCSGKKLLAWRMAQMLNSSVGAELQCCSYKH
eukprot:IDg1878t1